MTTQNLKKAIRSSLTALALAGTAHATDLTGNVKFFRSEEGHIAPGTYVEPNVWYSLPAGVKGYSFIDVYPTGKDNYFGKTILSKEILPKVNAMAQLKYVGRPLSEVNFGLKTALPVKEGYASLSLYPACFSYEGRRLEKTILGFAFGRDLGRGFGFESFGELKHSDGKISTAYVETELNREVYKKGNTSVKLGLNTAWQPTGKLTPQPEHRVMLRIDSKLRLGGKK